MRKSIMVLLCAASMGLFNSNVLARGPGGGANGAGFSRGAAEDHSQNIQSRDNSNGRFAQDRDTGLDRAQDRMSEQGLSHENANKTQEEDAVDGKNSSNTLTPRKLKKGKSSN